MMEFKYRNRSFCVYLGIYLKKKGWEGEKNVFLKNVYSIIESSKLWPHSFFSKCVINYVGLFDDFLYKEKYGFMQFWKRFKKKLKFID